MTLTTDNRTIGSPGGLFTVEVQCTVDYEVELPDATEWLREVATGTPDTGIHYFEADPNEEYDNRTASIVFTNRTFGLKQTFTLTQMQKNAILIAEESYSIDASGGTLDFEVNTNVDFRVELSETWIRQTTSPSVRGLVGRTLHFIIDPNPTTEPREATILLVADDVEQTITIRQQARDDMSRLHITHTNPTFRVPYIFGEEFVPGTVSWGDGTEEEYSESLLHTYQEAGTYTVTIETPGAEEFSVSDLTNVTKIDLTQF
ncbi:BACON domain-containing protein [uncultured Alistipes sp.]|uniref:BACON domain-containing protein n=1 Tax=uncultured Alistipes sp. TaxID=538949 RepID=UPI0025EA0143|nr:BACON domain-containing protein [uncultured Alistipes sp.]